MSTNDSTLTLPSGLGALRAGTPAIDVWGRRSLAIALGLLALVAGSVVVVLQGFDLDAELGGGTAYTVTAPLSRDDALDALDAAGISSGAEVIVTEGLYDGLQGVTVRVGEDHDGVADEVQAALASAAGVDADAVTVGDTDRGWTQSDRHRVIVLTAVSAGVLAFLLTVFLGWRSALAAVVAGLGSVAVTGAVQSLLGGAIGERHLVFAGALAIASGFAAVVVHGQYRANRQRFADSGLGTEDTVNVSVNQALLPLVAALATPFVIVLAATVAALIGGYGTVTGLGLLTLFGLAVGAAYAVFVCTPLAAGLGATRVAVSGVESSLRGDNLRRVVAGGGSDLSVLAGRKRSVSRAAATPTSDDGAATTTTAATTEQLLSHPARPRKKKRN